MNKAVGFKSIFSQKNDIFNMEVTRQMERDFIREEIPLALIFAILILFTVTLLYVYRFGEVLLVEPNRTILLFEVLTGIVAVGYVGNKLRKRFAYKLGIRK